MPPTGSEKVRLQSKDTASLVGFRPAPSEAVQRKRQEKAQKKPEAPGDMECIAGIATAKQKHEGLLS